MCRYKYEYLLGIAIKAKLKISLSLIMVGGIIINFLQTFPLSSRDLWEMIPSVKRILFSIDQFLYLFVVN